MIGREGCFKMYKKEIFNIFTKSEKIIKDKDQKEKIKIQVDYREKQSLLPSELISLGLEIEFKELKVADFIVKNIAIERKTVSDFISSMVNKRLLRQLEELQQYEKKLLIIEGIDEQELYSNEESEVIRMHPNSIRGFLLTILLRHNIPVLFTKDYKDSAKFIDLIARKKETELSLVAKKKARNKKEQMQFILESFPGIGPKTAKKLLQEFKSLKEIFNCPQEKLQKLIGKKADIFKLIQENY